MTITKKYYVLIPAAFRYSGKSHWKELCEVKTIIAKAKTLTSAQHYVDRIFGGLPAPEIGVSITGGEVTVVAQKNTAGKWKVMHKNSGSQS